MWSLQIPWLIAITAARAVDPIPWWSPTFSRTQFICTCAHSYYSVTHVNPANMSNNVLFPAPDGPMIAVNSPDLKSPFISRRICFSSAIKMI